MGTPVGQKAKGGKKNRKWYRNRVGRSSTAVTKYRSAHNIPEGSRQDNHQMQLCPVHAGRMTFGEHVKNRANRLAELAAKAQN